MFYLLRNWSRIGEHMWRSSKPLLCIIHSPTCSVFWLLADGIELIFLRKKKQSSHFARHSKGNFCLIFSQQMTIIPYSPVPQDYYDTLPFLLTQWTPLTFVLVILLHSALIYMWHIFGFVCIVYMGTLSWQKGANQYLI